MSTQLNTQDTAPSGRCDTCLHGIPLDSFCRPCEGAIVRGLAEVSAERVLVALEALAKRERDAVYIFRNHEDGVADKLIVIHVSHPWAEQRPEDFIGEYSYRMLWRGRGPSDALTDRDAAVKHIAIDKGQHRPGAYMCENCGQSWNAYSAMPCDRCGCQRAARQGALS